MSILALIVTALMLLPVSQASPQVSLPQGEARGRLEGDVVAWRGLPYAQPPVGDRRWKPPGPPPTWPGTRDASEHGAICIQPPANGDPGVGPLPMSEDCLTLGIWSPAARTDPLPVMIWIHGGGYNNGSGTADLYEGSNLARRGVVIVSINYRLGRFGFFDHPALAADRADGEAAANYGVMDQIAALEWVRDNIADFGGDPSNVTIFGESAGGVAVTQLMIAPAARGLFHRAVVQSGLGRQRSAELAMDRPGRPSAQTRGTTFARSVDLTDATAAQLRALPPEALLNPMPAFYTDNLIVDGQVLAEDVVQAFEAGRQAPVPLILGTNSAEFWWIKPIDPSAYGRADDGLTVSEHDALIEAYGGVAAYDGGIVSDLIFNEPVRHLARLHAGAGYPTWLYRFDVVPESNPEPSGGATHASERPYVFDTLHTVGRPMQDRDDRAAKAMAGYWTDFARSGDPNGGDRPAWPSAGGQGDPLLEFTNDGPVAKPMPFADRLNLIEAFHTRSR